LFFPLFRSYFISPLFFWGLIFFSFTKNFAQEKEDDLFPFDAVIQSEMGGKRFKFYGNTRFNFNQAYFSNWISGGESALTLLYGLDYNFNYSDRNGLVWDTNLLLSLGTTYLSGSKFLKKADDRFEINSLVGKQINKYWNYSGFLNFKTQLLPGFKFFTREGIEQRERISQFISPAILQGGLGFYHKKDQDFWLNLSPISARIIIVSQRFTENLEAGTKYFGVEANKRSKFFFGALFSGFFKKEIMENIIWENKYSFYVNYLEKTKNIDFDWNSNMRFKVNSKISGNFILHLLYDDDLLGKLQVRELLGLGINIDL
jgi:hypothetical protein